MRTIVIATGENDRLLHLTERRPAPLLPLVDRPFLQHVLEFLVQQGALEFDFVLSHLPAKVEDYFGDGRRWGASIRYHLAQDPTKPYRLIAAIAGECREPVLLAHGDRLPKMHLPKSACGEAPQVFSVTGAEGGKDSWTGWAWFPRFSASLFQEDLDETMLAARLLDEAERGEAQIVEVPQLLSIQTCSDFLQAQEAVLRKQSAALMLTSREVEPGIWIDRNVSLHPTARLEAPVYIGENCRIGRGVHLGPNAVISKNCVIDGHSRAIHAVVLPGSYVGEALELDHVIVDHNRLLNVRLETSLSVTEAFLLGSLAKGSLGASTRSVVSRLLASLLLLATWPLLLFTAFWLALFRKGPVRYRRRVVQLPASEDEAEWQTWQITAFRPSQQHTSAGRLQMVLLDFLPALPAIALGHLRFVGVAPRTPEEIRELPVDWRSLYLRTKAGIITEALVEQGNDLSEEELYSAEVFYSATASLSHDAGLAAGYLRRVLFGH